MYLGAAHLRTGQMTTGHRPLAQLLSLLGTFLLRRRCLLLTLQFGFGDDVAHVEGIASGILRQMFHEECRPIFGERSLECMSLLLQRLLDAASGFTNRERAARSSVSIVG